MTQKTYKTFAQRIRLETLRMIARAESSHIGSCFSIADILTVLYSSILKVSPKQPRLANRDRFILSKGHACAILYATLAEKGFFPKQWLKKYYLPAGRLAGHVVHSAPGIELSTGSLGHGLPVAVGMALGAKRDKKKWRVFCLLSDGELDEGSNWEALLFAPHHNLDNLTVIIDYNKIQSLDETNKTLNLEPLVGKLKSFNWAVEEIDGHNFAEIENTFKKIPFKKTRPSCIIAHTIKGKGVSFMENTVLWHYKNPIREELKKALEELQHNA